MAAEAAAFASEAVLSMDVDRDTDWRGEIHYVRKIEADAASVAAGIQASGEVVVDIVIGPAGIANVTASIKFERVQTLGHCNGFKTRWFAKGSISREESTGAFTVTQVQRKPPKYDVSPSSVSVPVEVDHVPIPLDNRCLAQPARQASNMIANTRSVKEIGGKAKPGTLATLLKLSGSATGKRTDCFAYAPSVGLTCTETLTWSLQRLCILLAAGKEKQKLSRKGLEYIMEEERFRGKLYNDAKPLPGGEPDPKSNCTIGYGHKVHDGPCDGTEPAGFKDGITKSEAYDLLLADVQIAVDAVNKHIDVPLSQDQFDALVSFTFNAGVGSLSGSNLRFELNCGRYDLASKELRRWSDKAGEKWPGLPKRRAEEADKFGTQPP